MLSVRKRVFEILEVAKPGDRASRAFDIFLVTLILLNVVAVILETVDSIADQFDDLFYGFELFSLGVFSIEYVLRIWSCTASERYSHPLAGRVSFALRPLVIVDLLAILPFFVPLLLPVDLRFLRAFRLFRIFRVLKLGRYSDAFITIGRTAKAKKEELLIAAGIVVLLLLISSSLMYLLERDAQPENFSSIPTAMWWGVATLTTVGYGDVYPITPAGKFVGAIIEILGIGLFALPAGILASGFSEGLRKKRSCPHCGKELTG